MIRRSLQFFFAAGLATSGFAAPNALETDRVHHIVLTDVDGNQLSTSDGHVTIITVTTRQDEVKAGRVGDDVPLQYIGDPHYRLITLVNFQQRVGPILRGITVALIRNRLDAEAKRLQSRYLEKNLARDSRQDIFVVADFDGSGVNQLGIDSLSAEFAVFLFDGEGRLLQHWSGVPPVEDLTAAMASAKK